MASGLTSVYSLPYPLSTDSVNVHGDIQSLAQTIDTILQTKSTSASPIFTGTISAVNMTLSGNLTVTGTTTTISTTNLEVTDPLIYIGTGNSANLNDLGVVGHFNDGTYQHTGLVRDATDGKWKLFSGITVEPTTTINFTTWTKDALVVGALEATSATFSAGTTSVAPIKLTSGTNLSAVTAGAVEYDGTVTTITPNTNFGRAPIATPIFTSGVGTSGIAATTNYALFPSVSDTITLPIGTYRIDMSIKMTVAGSTVSSAFPFNIRGSGTAVGSISWNGTSSITDAGTSNQIVVANTAISTTSSIALSIASAVAGRVYEVRGSGILKITTAGTIIPSYYWASAQTGGTVTLYADNYLIITPLSSSGTATSTGAWA